MDNAVRTQPDNTFFTVRTECNCQRCGSHFGYIFNDGPEPTGKRHCVNGLSLVFRPSEISPAGAEKPGRCIMPL